MYAPILKALNKGFSATQVIDYILKKFPKQADKIRQALSAGFTAEQVVGYLGGGKKFLNKSPEQSDEINTEYAKTRQTDIENQQSRNKTAAGIGAAAIGAAATPLVSSMATSALQRALPTSVQGLIPSIQKSQQSIPPSSQPPISPAQPPAQATIPQPPSPAQALTPKRDINKSLDIIKSSGLETNIKNMLEGGMSPSDVAAVLPRMAGKDLAKKLDKIEGGLEGVIQDYAESMPKPEANLPEQLNEPAQGSEQPAPMIEPQAPIEKEELTSEPKPIEKNSVVASPHGIGEVKEIRNGQAIIDVDGKKHKVSEDELIQSPLPEKELADLYDDVIKGIEKETGQQVSRNVEWAGYDANTNELAYKPHGSDKLYVYEDISPEDAQTLTSLLTKRKTTGSNHIGAWEANTTSPIGAAMHQLIKKLQSERGGKGNEYRGKYETIYDAIEPAKLASKRKHAEERKKAKKPRTS